MDFSKMAAVHRHFNVDLSTCLIDDPMDQDPSD